MLVAAPYDQVALIWLAGCLTGLLVQARSIIDRRVRDHLGAESEQHESDKVEWI